MFREVVSVNFAQIKKKKKRALRISSGDGPGQERGEFRAITNGRDGGLDGREGGARRGGAGKMSQILGQWRISEE
jgi:hypothetical protein